MAEVNWHPVRGYGGRDPVVLDPAIHKCVNDALGGRVCEWDRDGPTRESVYCREQILESVGLGKRDDVDI